MCSRPGCWSSCKARQSCSVLSGKGRVLVINLLALSLPWAYFSTLHSLTLPKLVVGSAGMLLAGLCGFLLVSSSSRDSLYLHFVPVMEQSVIHVHVAIWAAFWVTCWWQALNLGTQVHISAGLLSLLLVPQCLSASVSTSPFTSPCKSPSAIRKKEHKRRESMTVGLAFTSKGTLLETAAPISEECALLCAPFCDSSDIFLSSLPSILFSSFFFFLPTCYFLSSVDCAPFSRKKKSSCVTKLHVVCRRLFPQAQRHCGRRDDNLLKKPRREIEEKRHRACHFVLQNLHQTINTHWTHTMHVPGHAIRFAAPKRSSSSALGEATCLWDTAGHLEGWWKFTDKSISKLVINICKSLIYHCLKYGCFYVFLGREGIVLGLYLKVLAFETKVLATAF